MTPAKELAAAAAKLDALAAEATDGPWILAKHEDGRILGIDAHDGYDDVVTTGEVSCMAYCYGGTSTIEATDADWRYIAAMNPLVGKALAAWLRHEAEGAAHGLGVLNPTLDLARAINGGQS